VLVPVAQDGLIPPIFCKLDPVTRIPVAGAWLVTIPIGLLAFMLDLEQITKIISMGCLLTYSFVIGCLIALRLRDKNKPTERVRNENWVWAFLIVAFFASEATMKQTHPAIIVLLWLGTSFIFYRL
jgi:amino acid transporter